MVLGDVVAVGENGDVSAALQLRVGKARVAEADPCRQIGAAAPRDQVLHGVRGVEPVLVNRQVVSEGSVALVLSLTRPVLDQRGWGDIEAERRGRQAEALGAVTSPGAVVVEAVFVLLPPAGFGSLAPASGDAEEPAGGNRVLPGAFAPDLGEVGNVLLVGERLGVAPVGGIAVGPALPGQPRGVLADGDGVVGQHVGPQVGVERHRLDRAALLLELPVATSHHRTGGIVGGGHIGAGGAGQSIDEALAHKAFGNVAAIEQDVAAAAQGCADGGQQIGVGRQGRFIEVGTCQRQASFTAVAKDVDRLEPAAAGQCFGDLR